MSWHLSGSYCSPCSCKVGCPCLLGEPDGDNGWCSGSLLFNIRTGTVDGVDVSGARVALDGDWPRGFTSGNGKGRLYFDAALPDDKKRVLEAVFTGQRGGVLEAIGQVITSWLPPKVTSIRLDISGDETRVTVSDYGEMVVKPLRGATGEATRLLHGAAAFRDDTVLARGTGSRWHDPELRQWESGGHAEQAEFDWSA